MKKTIIFDFDGTIADTFVVIKTILLDLSKEFGYRVPTDEEIIKLKTMHPLEAMKMVGFSPIKLPFLLNRLNSEIHKQIKHVKPIKGIAQTLSELKIEGYPMGIVSSASTENIQYFLKNNNLEIFDFIQTGSNIFGKARILSQVLKKQKIDKENAIYVGDEIRDIEASKKVGIQIISVDWGFNDKIGLQKFHPDMLIDDPKMLLNAVKKMRH
jgi:phosphoglycolate phosphatase